jgi:hypothetical protein
MSREFELIAIYVREHRLVSTKKSPGTGGEQFQGEGLMAEIGSFVSVTAMQARFGYLSVRRYAIKSARVCAESTR